MHFCSKFCSLTHFLFIVIPVFTYTSLARRSAPLRMKSTNRLNPENNGGMQNVPLATRVHRRDRFINIDYATASLYTRGVHRNGEDWDPMGPMGSHGNGSEISHGMGMGIKCMEMGVKTWEMEKTLHRPTGTSKHLQRCLC